MGLDMNLNREYYIGAQYEWNEVTGNVDIFIRGEKVKVDLKDIKCIQCETVYWRKANMIHRWFVDHVQDGEDDCKPYYVGVSQLKELLDLCLKVRDNPDLAAELLPTQEGFFFGSTEYDESYFWDINYTIKELGKLNLINEYHGYSYYYESSW
jgi:hypothetical protein